MAPLCAGVGALAVVVRPPLFRGSDRWLDGALVACLVVCVFQVIPIPATVRDTVSPHAVDVARSVALEPTAAGRAAPVSVDPGATAWAVALAAAYIGLFWSARAIFACGGVRRTIRTVATLGLGLTVLVAVQRTTSPKLLYWTWQPLDAGASPYGPFVNRNGLAGWLAMAVPLAIGYVVARQRSEPRKGGLAAAVSNLDATTMLLAGSSCLMMVGLLGSLSRSGIFGSAVGLVTFACLARSRATGRRAAAGLVGGLAAMVAFAAVYANPGALAVRMQETTELGEWGRRVIWHDTIAMIRDFPLAGVGAGAFKRAMLVYQTGSRQFFFNHAHNEYLQIVAEGGLLLALPAAFAIVSGAVLVGVRLRSEHSASFWIRAGAIASATAIAIQSLFDTTLRTPADGVLFAIVAAIAVHERGVMPDRPHLGGRHRHTADHPSAIDRPWTEDATPDRDASE
jgi:O-antigen ligase